MEGEVKGLMVRIAKEVGKLLLERFKEPASSRIVREKGGYEFTTVADMVAEGCILKNLRESGIRCRVLSEETGEVDLGGGYTFFVDPLDGTDNYRHKIRHFAISMAAQEGDRVVCGVVYDPNLGELFLAERGKGAYLNGKRIRASKLNELELCLINFTNSGLPENFDLFRRVRSVSRMARIPGCQSLALCYTACSRAHATVILKTNPWDVSAGALMVEEAGGIVTDFEGRPWRPYSRQVLASSKGVHHQLMKLISLGA